MCLETFRYKIHGFPFVPEKDKLLNKYLLAAQKFSRKGHSPTSNHSVSTTEVALNPMK